MEKQTIQDRFKEAFIEAFKKNGILCQMRERQIAKKKREFEFKLKYGEQWHQYAYPHKYTRSTGPR